MVIQTEGVTFLFIFNIPLVEAFKGVKQIKFGMREGAVNVFGEFSAEDATFRHGNARVAQQFGIGCKPCISHIRNRVYRNLNGDFIRRNTVI